MKFVDAHIHLSDRRYGKDVERIISEAKESGVVALVSNSTGYETSVRNLKLAEKHPEIAYIALGVHPEKIESMTEEEYQRMRELILEQKNNKALVAVGEIGVDYKYAKKVEKQLEVFEEMLTLAERNNLPAIIHSRGTTEKVMSILSSYDIERVLLHWFSGKEDSLKKVIERGYYISEGVPTTYSKDIRRIIRQIPLTSLLTETDGPVQFHKHPFKDRKTTPAFIPTVVKSIAEIKNIERKEVSAQIRDNFETFFRVKLN